mmetsp:Transcript_3475/g.9210  ORF Transcript_3475/g.9210 Transcript_3475/m.9210 type:complete len:94 (-) Transcript_3475:80-361(-)
MESLCLDAQGTVSSSTTIEMRGCFLLSKKSGWVHSSIDLQILRGRWAFTMKSIYVPMAGEPRVCITVVYINCNEPTIAGKSNRCILIKKTKEQ